MKIAYIFHGHSRTWKQTYESFFENVFSVAPGDIFIHTWSDKINPTIGSYWNGWGELTGEAFEIANSRTDLTGISNAYNPISIIADKDPGPDLTLLSEENKAHPEASAQVGIKNMLYSARSAYNSAVSYDNYDRIFDLRLDIKFTSKLDIAEIESDKLYIPGIGYHDQLWLIGTVPQIDVETGFFHHIDDYWFKNPSFTRVHYELVFKDYLSHQNLQYGRDVLQSSLQYEIVRPF
jgi:hypothetical protein